MKLCRRWLDTLRWNPCKSDPLLNFHHKHLLELHLHFLHRCRFSDHICQDKPQKDLMTNTVSWYFKSRIVGAVFTHKKYNRCPMHLDEIKDEITSHSWWINNETMRCRQFLPSAPPLLADWITLFSSIVKHGQVFRDRNITSYTWIFVMSTLEMDTKWIGSIFSARCHSLAM